MTDTRRHTLYGNIIPASISGCFTFLISVTDGIIIGRGVSTAALGGVNIAVPFIFIYCALFSVVNAGGGTVAAVHMGKDDSDGAQSVFMHALFLNILIGIGTAVIGLLFFRTDTASARRGSDVYRIFRHLYLLAVGLCDF